MATVSIDSEEAAWSTLKGLVDGTIDAKNLVLDFSEAEWAKVHFNFKGDNFNQTVTASVMKGLLAYQEAFNRAVALILTADARTNRLRLDERDELELVFHVSEGSSDFLANSLEQLKSIGEKAVDKMTGKELAITAVVLALVFCGAYTFNNYLDRQFEDAKDARQVEMDRGEKKDLYEFLLKDRASERDKAVLINRALEASEQARRVSEMNRDAIDKLIRSNSGAAAITIQGEVIDNDLITSLVKGSRSTAKDVIIEEIFTVDAVISDDIERFTVRLKNTSTGELITATLDDPLVSEAAQKAISRAQWQASEIKVRMSARKVGDQIKDAKIIKAFKPRTKSAS